MPELTGNPNVHHESEFAESLSGACLCGSVQVTIHDKDLFTRPRGHLCHCANCRKVAGSYVSANLLIEEDKVEIIDRNGTLKVYEDAATGSGVPLFRYFCSTCGKYVLTMPVTFIIDNGSPIKSVVPAFKGKVIIKMGMFPRIPRPEAETFALHRHDWQGTHDGLDQYKIKLFQERLGD